MGIWANKDLFYKNVLIPFNQWMDRGAQHVDFLVWRGIVIILKKQNENRMDNVDALYIYGSKKSIDTITQRELRLSFNLIDLESLKPNDFKVKQKIADIHGEISEVDWKEIYKLGRLVQVDNCVKDLQYKILFRFLPTNRLLYKMHKVNTPNCTFCLIEQESLEHLFFYCQVTRNFWLHVCNLWNSVSELKIQLSAKDIILGKYCAINTESIYVNLIIVEGKAFIWSCKQNGDEINLIRFLNRIKNTVKRCCESVYKGPIVEFCNSEL